jgi:hypothetical protein
LTVVDTGNIGHYTGTSVGNSRARFRTNPASGWRRQSGPSLRATPVQTSFPALPVTNRYLLLVIVREGGICRE